MPPEEIVHEVATIFNSTSAPIIISGRCPSIANWIHSYPPDMICGQNIAISPSINPPTAGFVQLGIGSRLKNLSRAR